MIQSSRFGERCWLLQESPGFEQPLAAHQHTRIEGECIRPGTPLWLDDARRLVERYVGHFNNVRLNSAVGYITQKDISPVVRRRSTPRGIGSYRAEIDIGEDTAPQVSRGSVPRR
jgi:hypothetical protein